MTGTEELQFAATICGVALLLMIGISLVLKNFVALRARPAARAAWTTAASGLIAGIMIYFGMPGMLRSFAPYAPATPIVGAPILFWYWHGDFRASWTEYAAPMPPDGMTRGDWIANLRFLAIMVLFSAILFVFGEFGWARLL